MNEQISNFFEALKATDIGTKFVVGISALALIGAVAVVGAVSNEEHFEVAFTGLSDAQFAAVSTAIAQAGIDMETYRGNGQSTILTRKDDVYKAKGAAFSAGAISVQGKGILGGSSGASNIFAGADEREQITREKEMSEIEKTIENLDYITRAELVMPKSTPSALSRAKKESVSMVVHTIGGRELSGTESQSVALMLQGALDIPMEKVVITDQSGRLVHGGSSDDAGQIDGRALEMQNEYNRAEEARINAHLAGLWGPDKARVTVNSEFDFSQSTVVTRQADEPVTISNRTSTTETPIGGSSGSAGGGIAGSQSNIAASGDSWAPEDAVVTGAGGAGVTPAMATTSETETASFIPTIDTTEIHNQPKLKRLSISLVLDESLLAQKTDIDATVKSMLAFSEARSDVFTSMTTAIQPTPIVEEAAPGEGEAAPSGGLGMQTLLENGVELVSALAFIFLLFKGLKGAKGSKTEAASAAGEVGAATVSADGTVTKTGAPVEISPEVLARAQVDDLVQNNPERVAQILSNWVIEGRTPVNN